MQRITLTLETPLLVALKQEAKRDGGRSASSVARAILAGRLGINLAKPARAKKP